MNYYTLNAIVSPTRRRNRKRHSLKKIALAIILFHALFAALYFAL